MNSHCKTETVRPEINHVGVDVSKQHLDVSFTGQKNRRFANTPSGLHDFHLQLVKLHRPRVTCEATGGYEKRLVAFLHEREVEVCVAAPGRVRYMAQAEGLFAKTDAIDAGLIRRFSEKIGIPVQNQPDPSCVRLREMCDFRRMLCEDIVKTGNRLDLAEGYLREQLVSQLADLESRKKRVDADIDAHMRTSENLAKKSARLQQLKGVGPVLATTLLAHVPELGQVGYKTLACLIGVAAHPRQSGNSKSRAHIRGGRANVRHVLYMAAVTAARCNPVLRAFYQKLCTKGNKPAKVALVAVMRKMLCVLNKMIACPNFSLAS